MDTAVFTSKTLKTISEDGFAKLVSLLSNQM